MTVLRGVHESMSYDERFFKANRKYYSLETERSNAESMLCEANIDPAMACSIPVCDLEKTELHEAYVPSKHLDDD